MSDHYDYTKIETVYVSNPVEDTAKFALGIVTVVEDTEFGFYGDCGIVHEEPKREPGTIEGAL